MSSPYQVCYCYQRGERGVIILFSGKMATPKQEWDPYRGVTRERAKAPLVMNADQYTTNKKRLVFATDLEADAVVLRNALLSRMLVLKLFVRMSMSSNTMRDPRGA